MGVIVVRVVPVEQGVWYLGENSRRPDQPGVWPSGDSGLRASLRRLSVAGHAAELRPTKTPGVLVADGLASGQYDLSIRHIAYVPRTDRVTIRAGYADTILATLDARLLCFIDPIIQPRGIFDGTPRYP